MLVYIVQLILILILGFFIKPSKSDSKKSLFLFWVFIILCFVACLRNYTVGYDTKQYVTAFNKAASLTLSNFSYLRYEYGYTFLLWFLNKISSNWQILLVITSLFINFSVLRFIKKNSENPFLSVLIYILLNFYFFYTSAMRQAIAISIVLIGYEYLKKNNNVVFFIYVLIATLFHQSALLAFLIPLMKNVKYNKLFIFILFFIYFIGFIFGKNFFIFITKFSSRLLDYSDSKFFVENYFGALLQFLLNFMLFIIGYLIMLKNDRNILYDKSNNNNTLIGVLAIANLFLLLTVRVGIFNRFSPYFAIFIIIWLPNMIMKLKKSKDRMLVYICCFSVLILYWTVIGVYRPEWYGMIPYQFFF